MLPWSKLSFCPIEFNSKLLEVIRFTGICRKSPERSLITNNPYRIPLFSSKGSLSVANFCLTSVGLHYDTNLLSIMEILIYGGPAYTLVCRKLHLQSLRPLRIGPRSHMSPLRSIGEFYRDFVIHYFLGN